MRDIYYGHLIRSFVYGLLGLATLQAKMPFFSAILFGVSLLFGVLCIVENHKLELEAEKVKKNE